MSRGVQYGDGKPWWIKMDKNTTNVYTYILYTDASYVIIIRLVMNSWILCFMMKRWCDKVCCIYVVLNREIKILIPNHRVICIFGIMKRIKNERSRKLKILGESSRRDILYLNYISLLHKFFSIILIWMYQFRYLIPKIEKL